MLLASDAGRRGYAMCMSDPIVFFVGPDSRLSKPGLQLLLRRHRVT